MIITPNTTKSKRSSYPLPCYNPNRARKGETNLFYLQRRAWPQQNQHCDSTVTRQMRKSLCWARIEVIYTVSIQSRSKKVPNLIIIYHPLLFLIGKPLVAAPDHDLQENSTYCTFCLYSVIPPVDHFSSVYCSTDCETRSKHQSQNLMFGCESVPPLRSFLWRVSPVRRTGTRLKPLSPTTSGLTESRCCCWSLVLLLVKAKLI